MLDFLYAFGVGISFVIGVGAGTVLCVTVTKRGNLEMKEQINKHNEMVESRLEAYVFNTERIATVLEKIEFKT